MDYYGLQVSENDTFEQTAELAKSIAVKRATIVVFGFKGVRCFVDSNTNLDWLAHDYVSQFNLLECMKELETYKCRHFGTEYFHPLPTQTYHPPVANM